MPDLTRSQQLMIADGLPAAAIISPEERRKAWNGKRLRPTKSMSFAAPKKDEDPATKALRKELAKAEERKKAERFARLNELKQQTQRAKAQPQETIMIAMKTNPTPLIGDPKPSKAEQVKELRERRATTKGPKKATKAVSGKKAAKAKARTPTAPKAAAGAAKAIRPGSKLEIVVGLLTRKEGCTTAEILKATEWPSVSVPQQARAAGLKLRQEKDGKVTRYWAA